MIYPGELTDQELMKQKVSEAVSKAAEEQRYEREVILPGEIAGYRLQMPSDTGRIIAVILIGGIVIMLMLWMRKRENLHREVSLIRVLLTSFNYIWEREQRFRERWNELCSYMKRGIKQHRCFIGNWKSCAMRSGPESRRKKRISG